MKIVIFAHSFPPIIGGGQTYQYYLAKFLSDFGHQVKVLTGTIPADYENKSFPYEGFEVVSLEGFKEASKLKIPLDGFIEKAYQAIAPFDPDIVYTQGFSPCLIYSLIQASLSAKHVFTYHSTPIPEDKKIVGIFKEFELEKSFSKFIFQCCPYELYIANSKYYLDNAIQGGVPKEKSSLVYHGIDLNLFNDRVPKNRSKYGYSEGDFVIVSPIRLIERKGILDLIEALRILNDQSIKLFIPTSRLYTSKEFENIVLEKIKSYNLGGQIQVVFDKIDMFEMPEVYVMSDLMVLPSHIEGLGIVLLESLAVGTPVVSTHAPGITEIIRHGENGLLAQIKNPEDLATKILYARNNPGEMAKLVSNGTREVKEEFNIINQVKKIENLFTKLLEK